MSIANAIKKDHVKAVSKRKRNRTATDSDNSEDDDHETNIISREQLRRFQKENKARQARLKRLEAAVDKLMQQSYHEDLS
jgi:hypothetical protein